VHGKYVQSLSIGHAFRRRIKVFTFPFIHLKYTKESLKRKVKLYTKNIFLFSSFTVVTGATDGIGKSYAHAVSIKSNYAAANSA
jgi:hypothetical protein